MVFDYDFMMNANSGSDKYLCLLKGAPVAQNIRNNVHLSHVLKEKNYASNINNVNADCKLFNRFN